MIMRILVTACVFAWVVAPAFSSAQGISGYRLVLGAPVTVGEWNSLGNVSFLVGWVNHSKGFNYSYGSPSDGYWEKAQHPIEGIWLGAEITKRIWTDLTFRLSGGGLISSDDTELSVFYPGWNDPYVSDSQWGIVDGCVAYNFFGAGELIGGFRWDFFTTRWSSDWPDYYDHKINCFFPYVGIQSRLQGATSSLTARAVGWPDAMGHLKYEYQYPGGGGYELSRPDISDGYFAELSLEYEYSGFAPQCEIGLFARYTALQALSQDPIEISTYGYQGLSNKIEYRRHTWTLGGSVTASFSSTDLPAVFGL